MRIGLQFAMPAEFHAMPGAADMKEFEKIAGAPFYEIQPDIIACAGGIGKVNAAMSAEILCLKFHADMIVSAGVAGCLTDLPRGKIVIPTEFIQHDMDTSAIGDPMGFVSTVNVLKFPVWKPEYCAEILHEMGVEAATGRAVTGDWFATASENPPGDLADKPDAPDMNLIRENAWIPASRARWIRDLFQPVLIEMEGGAIAQVCYRNQVPFVALKSVSDHLFGSQNQVDEYFDFQKAMTDLGKILLPFVLKLQREGL